MGWELGGIVAETREQGGAGGRYGAGELICDLLGELLLKCWCVERHKDSGI